MKASDELQPRKAGNPTILLRTEVVGVEFRCRGASMRQKITLTRRPGECRLSLVAPPHHRAARHHPKKRSTLRKTQLGFSCPRDE